MTYLLGPSSWLPTVRRLAAAAAITSFLTEPARRRRITALGLPIIAGMLSQTLLALVDTFMIGVLGDEALAGVGLGSLAMFVSVAVLMGLSVGVQAMAARRLGEGRTSELAVPLNAGLALAGGLGLSLTIVLLFLSPGVFGLLTHDSGIVALGLPYWQVRLLALVGAGMNGAFRGHWNGVSRSGLYLRTLLLVHVTNFALNMPLIFGLGSLPGLGTLGAGIATTVATYLGTAYYCLLGHRHARGGGFLIRWPDRQSFRTLMRLAIPSGAQQFFLASGLVAFFARNCSPPRRAPAFFS